MRERQRHMQRRISLEEAIRWRSMPSPLRDRFAQSELEQRKRAPVTTADCQTLAPRQRTQRLINLVVAMRWRVTRWQGRGRCERLALARQRHVLATTRGSLMRA